MVRISQAFFNRHPVECARELIGGHFHWDGCSGRIVETEAYLSIGDEACHTWFRPTARAFVARHPEGTAYVYLNYPKRENEDLARSQQVTQSQWYGCQIRAN